MRSMRFKHAELVMVSRYQETGEVDRYGDPISTWVDLPEKLRCAVADKATVMQFTPGRIEIDFDFTIYMEAGQTVLPADILTVRGQRCKVVVPQADWQSPFVKWLAGSTVYVKAEVG